MALLGTSLSAVTTDADGSPIFFDVPKSDVSMQYSGAGTATMLLQGTINGSDWSNLASVTTTGGAFGGLIGSSGKPVIGIRASVTNLQVGGNASASVAGA